MRIYTVGGAVRDELLGLPVQDRDYVVVGASPEAMLARGFKPVGKDFPVFLHPETHEEYALARTERKAGHGYKGFTFHASPEVTLEEDLARRDLTINAIAKAPGGELIDPFGGVADIQKRVLRHVGPACAEDPVRLLRVARFAARFEDFSVAPETLALMRRMVESGEADHLVAERVWQEIARGLMETAPSRLIRTLRDCGALARLLPALDRLFGVPQRADYHPEIDAGEHILLSLDSAARKNFSLPVRFAVLLHDLGKALIPLKILNKPGKLTDEEFGIMKTHPAEGYRLLRESAGIDDIVLDVVLHHHEKIDSSGYPEGRTAGDISLYAKMGAVCDVYDAITSNRPYKAGWDPAESLRKMAEWSSHFDTTIFQAFVKSLGIYPIGSLLRLTSGRIGVVIAQSPKSLLTPRVKVFFSTRGDTRIPPELIDLSAPGCTEKIAAREDPARWNFPDLVDLWSSRPAR